jgi:LacI family transcriptional regulator
LFASGSWQAAKLCIDVFESGLHVPDDVAILSSGNNSNVCQSCIPTISSLDIDEEGHLHTACDWLEKLMKGEALPENPIMIPPKGVIERESTNILATSDRVVAEALRYIWDHLQNDLSVDDIADVVGLSTSQLQRRFRTALGRSVVQELLRKRLDEARHLLRATNLPIADIGPKLGFHSDSYFYRSFRKRFGMTPAQYRRKQ